MPSQDPLETIPGDAAHQVDAPASDARWKLAFEANGDGVWDWDVPSGRVDVSPGLKTMLGHEVDAPWSSLKDWEDRVHPDDLQPTMAAVQAHLDGRTHAFAAEHRLRCADGSWKWILGRGMVLTRDEHGAPLRVIGSHTDISESKQAKDALSAERRLLETVLEHSPIGFAVYAVSSPVPLYVSARFEQIYGVPRGTLDDVSRVFDDVFTDPLERETTRQRVEADLASGDASRMRWEDVPLTLRSGQRRWITAVTIPVPGQQLMVATVQDVTHTHLANDALVRRTEQLRERNDELVRFNHAAVDRELRMVELKQEVNALLARLGEPLRYRVDV